MATGDLICKLPGCNNPRYYHPTRGFLGFCGKSHAEAYYERTGIRRRSRRTITNGEDAEAPLCRNPSCSWTCHLREDGGYFNYCGRTCARIYHNLSGSQVFSTPASLRSLPGHTLPQDRRGRYQAFADKVIVEIYSHTQDFQEVSQTFTKQWVKPSLMPAPTHLKVFKVCNQILETQFQTYTQSLRHRYQSTEAHFHGTVLCCDLAHTKSACTQSECGICGISRRGFDPGKIGSNISRFKRFGMGMYLAPNSSKCHEYTQGCSGYRALILCDVAPGRKYTVTHDQTRLKAPPQGYDSVYGQHGGSLNYDEIVLYNEHAILPKYVIMYQKDGVGQIAT